MSLSLYTLEASQRGLVTGTPQEIANYPSVNALDFNPLTHWGITTAYGSRRIEIDCGKAITVDGVGIWIRDYTTNFYDASGYYHVQYSNTAGAWTSWVTSHAWPNAAVGPFYILHEPGTSQTRRYWAIEIGDLASSIYITHVLLFRKYIITTGHLMPWSDGVRFFHTKRTTPCGHIISEQYRLGSNHLYTRNYRVEVSRSDIVNWQTVNRACCGARYPFLLNEGTTDAEAMLMSFDDDDFDIANVADGIDTVQVKLVEEPYLRAS